MGKSKLCTAGAETCVLPTPKAGRDQLETQAGGSPRAQPPARNSFSISYITPNKSFPVSRVFTHRRQQHPRPVQAVLSVQLEGTSTTTAAEDQDPLRSLCKAEMLLQLRIPGKHLPLLRPVLPPVRSHHRAARGWQQEDKGWAQEEHTEAGATTLMGHGLGPGAQDPLENTNLCLCVQCDPNSVTYI